MSRKVVVLIGFCVSVAASVQLVHFLFQTRKRKPKHERSPPSCFGVWEFRNSFSKHDLWKKFSPNVSFLIEETFQQHERHPEQMSRIAFAENREHWVVDFVGSRVTQRNLATNIVSDIRRVSFAERAARRVNALCQLTHDSLFNLDRERLSQMCSTDITLSTLISSNDLSEASDDQIRVQMADYIMSDLTSILENLSISTLMFVLCERGVDFVHSGSAKALSRSFLVELIRKSCQPQYVPDAMNRHRFDREESMETHTLKLQLEESDYSRQLLERKNSKLLRLLERENKRKRDHAALRAQAESKTKRLLKEREASREQMVCCICLEGRRTVAFGCGHLCCCDQCGSKRSGLLKCPMCRRFIRSRLHIFSG